MFEFLWRRKPTARDEIKKALNDVKLPTFPKVAHETMRMLRDPDTPTKRISDTLARVKPSITQIVQDRIEGKDSPTPAAPQEKKE